MQKPDSGEPLPLIIFDECHKAKNLVNETGIPTSTGKAVEVLQAEIPNAAVLYSSATGVSGARCI